MAESSILHPVRRLIVVVSGRPRLIFQPVVLAVDGDEMPVDQRGAALVFALPTRIFLAVLIKALIGRISLVQRKKGCLDVMQGCVKGGGYDPVVEVAIPVKILAGSRVVSGVLKWGSTHPDHRQDR